MKNSFTLSLLFVVILNTVIFLLALLIVGSERAYFLTLFSSLFNFLTILISPGKNIFSGFRLIPRTALLFVLVIVFFTSFLPIGGNVNVERAVFAILGLNFFVLVSILFANMNENRRR